MRYLLVLLTILPITSVKADATGATDMLQLEQLIAIFQTVNQSLKEFQEMTDIQGRMEQLEAAKTVRKLTEQGDDMKDLMREMENTGSILKGIQSDPGGINDLNQTIKSLENSLDSADKKEGVEQIKAYARIASDLKRIRFIRNANRESIEDIAAGTNQEDNQALTATSTAMMSEIIAQQEQRDLMKSAHETKAINELMRGTRYSSMIKKDN